MSKGQLSAISYFVLRSASRRSSSIIRRAACSSASDAASYVSANFPAPTYMPRSSHSFAKQRSRRGSQPGKGLTTSRGIGGISFMSTSPHKQAFKESLKAEGPKAEYLGPTTFYASPTPPRGRTALTSMQQLSLPKPARDREEPTRPASAAAMGRSHLAAGGTGDQSCGALGACRGCGASWLWRVGRARR